MRRDLLLLLLLSGSGATWVTAHVALAWGLLGRHPRFRAPAALLIVPLALYWGLTERMRWRAGLWCASLVGYGLTWWLSRSG